MKAFLNIGAFDDKKIEYKRNVVLQKDMWLGDAFSYIMSKGFEYLPSHETMDFVDTTNKYSLFNLIVSTATMAWMIDIQKQEQKTYTASFSMNGESGTIGDRKIRYSVGSGTKFEIDGWVNGLKWKLISALTGKYHSEIIVRRLWTEKIAKIEILDIMNVIFWTEFVRKIQESLQWTNLIGSGFHLQAVTIEINKTILSIEAKNLAVNEALFGMMGILEEITLPSNIHSKIWHDNEAQKT